MTNPIPKGYHNVTPYLVVDGAAKAIDFYTKAFGAKERMRLPMGDRIGHAELEIGDSVIMLADPCPMGTNKAPQSKDGKNSVMIYLYVKDVNATFPQAVSAGGKELMPLKDQFYGDRTGSLVDPFGHSWCLATHVEDVSPKEMERRMAEFSKAA